MPNTEQEELFNKTVEGENDLMKDDLKKCPFCGKTPFVDVNNEWHNNNYRFIFIRCPRCNARGPQKEFSMYATKKVYSYNEAKKVVSDLWNKMFIIE